MIIIKTTKGDVFVNEKTTHVVQHDRQNKTAVIRNPNEGLNCNIRDVEGVLYTSDAQPTSWQDDGLHWRKIEKDNDAKRNIIERLKKEKKAALDDLLKLACHMEQLLSTYYAGLPDDIRELLRKPALEFKSKVLNHGYDGLTTGGLTPDPSPKREGRRPADQAGGE